MDFYIHKSDFIVHFDRVIIDKKKVGAKWYILLRPTDGSLTEWADASYTNRIVDGGLVHGVYNTEALADAEIVLLKAAAVVAGAVFY